MKKILVIGGSGFIGSYLIERLLKQKVEIFNFDIIASNQKNNQINTIVGDVRKPSDFKSIPCDIDQVYILAAIHKDNIKNSQKYYDTNHIGIKNIIKYCQSSNISKILFYSSASVYGDIFNNITEDNELFPTSHYGKSKYLAEQELSKWKNSSKDRKLIIIRPSVVYGKGSDSNMNRMIDSIAKRRFMMVGKGLNVKSICYVENLVDFTCYITDRISRSETFNYADTPNYKMKDIVFTICEALNSKIRNFPYVFAFGVSLLFDLLSSIFKKDLGISSSRIKKFCSNTSMNTEKVENLNFTPTFNFIESINKTIK